MTTINLYALRSAFGGKHRTLTERVPLESTTLAIFLTRPQELVCRQKLVRGLAVSLF